MLKYNMSIPKNDLFIQFDLNVAETRTLLSRSTGPTPTEDLHDFNIKTVKTTTLNELLKKYDFHKIDFMNLDIEGHELEVLKSINFKEFDIESILKKYEIEYDVWNNRISKYIHTIYENYKIKITTPDIPVFAWKPMLFMISTVGLMYLWKYLHTL